jgi:hypothetical protein
VPINTGITCAPLRRFLMVRRRHGYENGCSTLMTAGP